MNQINWNISVSPDTDRALRRFLAGLRGDQKTDAAQFIEEAVKAHILELTAAEAKAANADLSDDELNLAVEEALQWARQ